MKYSLLPLAPLCVAGFVGIWCLVVKLISLLAWQPLARHFAVAALPAGTRVRVGFAHLGLVRYQGTLQAMVTTQGLGLSTGFPFRIGHVPLLIPWAALGPFRAEKSLWTTLYTTRIDTGPGPGTSFTFTGDELLQAARPWIQLETHVEH
ncbi:hypothetical protein [Hymenobacter cellulosivorans]|uniref:DUF4166 domain-containing protein n=1 Tax=Hymenobacter cellulosivorans TaxID=2932249 RepID=A0ABY4F2Y7_9BACT|nr:hypothetical protein [Hymenobacter cellulosivorans]UOQ50893.1 hypothetical protein MUN80_14115 [Hymenobacter cellulosivorans]